jgi:SpoVK/Ycf46/Vps4 family AAA+-type ATPase
MENIEIENLFEQAIIYPDVEIKKRLARLVGLDKEKDHLSKTLGLLVNPKGLEDWIEKYHPDSKNIIDIVLRRPPLIILAGDVGSGKTELASTIGDMVARQEQINITLMPLSLSSRGNGRVGQMTQLITSAFDLIIEKAKKLQSGSNKMKGAIILLIDEADALAQSRENNQMHHEDKAGVNAFIRGIDNISNKNFPIAVIMCTNRPNALDPAIKRRASDIFYFRRPNKEQRYIVLKNTLEDLGIDEEELNELAEITGQGDGFTFSDLIQRLIPTIILDAYPSNAVSAIRAKEIAQIIIPTPPFKEG